MTREEAIDIVKCLAWHDLRPSEEDIEQAIKALEQEPCEDAISRQWLMECVNEGWIKFDTEKDENRFIHLVRDIAPPVNPQPKTGRWIEQDGFDGDTYYDCSECGESWITIEGTPWDNEFKYCPSCGCRMIEPQERSEE